VRGGEEWKDRQSIASPRLAIFLSIIIIFFFLPFVSFCGRIVYIITTATSVVTVVVIITIMARVSSIIVMEAVIFILLIVVCFCKIRCSMSSMGGERPNRRNSRWRDTLMPSRNATGRSRPRATQRCGGHLQGLVPFCLAQVRSRLDVAAVRLEARFAQHCLAGNAMRVGREKAKIQKEEATSRSRFREFEWRGKRRRRKEEEEEESQQRRAAWTRRWAGQMLLLLIC
jgi:hypothetical protein